MSVFKAIQFGAMLAFMIGPSFFYLLGVSIKQGFKKAISFALGIAISDLAILLLVLYGLKSFMETPDFQKHFSLASVFIMFGISYYYFRLAHHPEKVKTKDQTKNLPAILYFSKGIIINSLNPFTLMLWIWIGSQIGGEQTLSLKETIIFCTVLITTIFCFDSIKAYTAKTLTRYFSDKNLRKIDYALSAVFFVLGIRFVVVSFIQFS